MQSLGFSTRDCVFLFRNEKETRTKVGYPCNANVISVEHPAFAVV